LSIAVLKSLGDYWPYVNYGDTPANESTNWKLAMGKLRLWPPNYKHSQYKYLIYYCQVYYSSSQVYYWRPVM